MDQENSSQIGKGSMSEKSETSFCDFFAWATAIPNAIPLYEGTTRTAYHEDGEGWISWPAWRKDALELGAHKARDIGFTVVETDVGWSAVLPINDSWTKGQPDGFRGACIMISVGQIRSNENDIVFMRSREIRREDDIDVLEKEGWMLRIDLNGKPVYEFNCPLYN